MITAIDRPLAPDAFDTHRMRGFDVPNLQRDAAHALEVINLQARQAQEADAPAAIEFTSVRLTRCLALEAQAAAALPLLEDGEATHAACVRRALIADAVWRAGTPDEGQAVRNWNELIAAHAAERHQRAAMPALRSAVSSPLSAMARMLEDVDGRLWSDVVAETSAIVDTLLSKYGSPDAAVANARKFGEASKAARAAIWPVAEAVAMKAFLEEIKGADETFRAGRQWRNGDNNPPPTAEELQSAFAARSAGFESARSAARAAVMALG